MFKILGGVMVGVFIGAFTVEVVRRVRPMLLTEIERAAKGAKGSFVGAFRDSYRS